MRGARAGTEAQTMEEHSSWLAPLACTQPAFLYNPRPPSQMWQHPQWAGPSHITQQSRTCLTDMGTGQPDRDNFPIEVPSSQVCQVDKITQHRMQSGSCRQHWWEEERGTPWKLAGSQKTQHTSDMTSKREPISCVPSSFI